VQWFSEAISNGRPLMVLTEILHFLQKDLTANEAEKLAREIIEAIPHFVAEPTEWTWYGRIEWDSHEKARAILLRAQKPRRKWSHRIRLPL
jgi:hypothetical protein